MFVNTLERSIDSTDSIDSIDSIDGIDSIDPDSCKITGIPGYANRNNPSIYEV